MKSIHVFSLLLALLCAVATGAQERTSLGLYYQYGWPAGSFKKDLIGEGSARGAALDILYGINNRWQVGGVVTYQDFYQKNPRNTYRMEDGSDISAVVSNSVQTTALMAKAVWLPLGADSSRLQPFVHAGAGAGLVQYSQLLGEFSNGSDAWIRPAFQGGAGVRYALGNNRRTELSLGAVYQHMPLNKYSIANTSHLALQAGLRFRLRGGSNGRSGDVWQQRRPNHYDRGW